MADTGDLETRLARIIEYHVIHGVLPSTSDLQAETPELASRLLALAERYVEVSSALDGAPGRSAASDAGSGEEATCEFTIEGFRTIERLGAGGMGEVYKLRDLTLNRVVAAKVLRRDADPAIGASFAGFLSEARSLALFSDPRVVQVFDFRDEGGTPVIVMEFVEGFELGRLGPSLEFRQRAKVMHDVCEAIERAHALGLTHRDLKPSNIMLDGRLGPKILDFGLSSADTATGHLRGTLSYISPEQLDPAQPIDARTDVYALGVILYELVAGIVPYGGAPSGTAIDDIRRGQPRLPVEIDPLVPAGLQAIALKAMERRPADRYQSARAMALDLARYLDGRPVLARPTLYDSTLAVRMRPHLDQIAEWLRLRLIYPHEAARLRGVYHQLDAREDDWFVAGRALTYSQIALYLGAFLLCAGSLFYFGAHRLFGAATGLVQPFIVLGVPFIGITVAGRWLYRRDHPAVAVAFLLAGVSVLPLFLLIWFPEAGWFSAGQGTANQLFDPGTISNRQLQIAMATATVWALWLALLTRTGALSAVVALLVTLVTLSVLADAGLRSWLEHGLFDRLALHLAVLVPIYAVGGHVLDRLDRPWFARPLYVAGVIALVAILDLFALNGRLLAYLHVSVAPLQSGHVSQPLLLDTVVALTMNGVIFYMAAAAMATYGTAVMAPASQLLFTIAPFSILEPLAYLVETAEYSARLDWLYLAAALGIAILSRQHQRKSFYYAGLVNTGVALYLIAARRQWFDKPSWAMALVAAGLVTLVAGFFLDAASRRRAASRAAAD